MSVAVYAQMPLTLTAWRGIPPEVTYTVLLPPFLTAPVVRGEQVGTLIVRTGNTELAQLPLLAAGDVAAPQPETEQPGLLARVIRRIRSWF